MATPELTALLEAISHAMDAIDDADEAACVLPWDGITSMALVDACDALRRAQKRTRARIEKQPRALQ